MKKTIDSTVSMSTYMRALRPKQWVKNLLVVAAPVAAGDLFKYFDQILLGLVSFIFASSLGYLLNDWRDRQSDREHPTKRNRPFATGELSYHHFLCLSAVCLIAATLPLAFLPSKFAGALLIYLVISFSYSLLVKKIPVLEMIWLCSGFLIRALAGSQIILEPTTGWFVTSSFFGALFVISGKRLAEFKSRGGGTRRVLDLYSEDFLRIVISTSLSITILTYSLWVFQVQSESVAAQVSILPFTFTMLMYLHSCDRGDAEVPEELMFSNKFLLGGLVLTAFLLMVVFYG